jgi:hypothetical protein
MAAVRFCNSVADMMVAFTTGERCMVYPANVPAVSGIILSITREDGSGLSYIVKVCTRDNVYTDVYVRFTQ